MFSGENIANKATMAILAPPISAEIPTRAFTLFISLGDLVSTDAFMPMSAQAFHKGDKLFDALPPHPPNNDAKPRIDLK